MRLPDIPSALGFTRFSLVSPPLTLFPAGEEAALYRSDLQNEKISHPIPVQSYRHEGATFLVTYIGGSVVRIQRMHATN